MECFEGHRLMGFTIDVFYRSRKSYGSKWTCFIGSASHRVHNERVL